MTFPATSGPVVAAGATGEIVEHLGDAASLLTAGELGRAQRLRSVSDRADFVAAHGLVRLVAAMVLGGAPRELTVLQRCSHCGGDHGQAHLAEAPDLQVSWSHTRGFVAAIAGFVVVAVDVDHPPRQVADDALLRLALSPRERAAVARAADPAFAFARSWVRKESLVKLGLSTLDTLADTDLVALPVEPPWSAPTGGQRLVWRDWHLIEWSHRETGTVGTAMAAAPPSLCRIADLPHPGRLRSVPRGVGSAPQALRR